MSTFKFRDKNIFYVVEGQGKPIIILNGIMMSTRSWSPFVGSLSEKNQLIRFDFLDQGQSDKLIGETYTQDIQVELIKALMEHLHLDKASLVGISYGGSVAVQFAIKYPSFVDRLLLFNTTSYTSPWLRDIGRGWIEAGQTRNGEAYYHTTIPPIYSPYFYETNIDWMQKRQALLVPIFSNPEFLDQMERLTFSAESYDVRASLSKITAKTLIITAEEDYLTPIANQAYLHQNIKHSEWIKIPNTGHASMYERPLLFTTLVLGFVNVKDTEYTI
jgi:pimeloyl-ACP methyl ester carboxylesterase